MKSNDLLSSPDEELIAKFEMGDNVEQRERSASKYVNKSARFKTTSSQKEKAFKTQFAQIYYQRLVQMRPALKNAAEIKWRSGNSRNHPQMVDKILNLVPGEKCIVVGTLYKEMKLKPNILDEYHARETYEAPPAERSKYNSTDDSVVIEDQSGRVVLGGATSLPQDLVSGVVIAVLGIEDATTGDFIVEDYCFADAGPQPLLPQNGGDSEDDVYIALISGLNIGSGNAEELFPLQLFMDFVTGQLGSSNEQQTAGRIVRVVVAGNSIQPIDKDSADVAAYKQKGLEAKTVSSVHDLDQVLAQLSSCVPVDIMSGANDPSNQTVPQQPMHKCMFPRGASSGLLRGVTNPYDFQVNGVNFIGTSGQNIDDIKRFSHHDDHLNILECVWKWRHLCPTAPDTLGCFPFYENDPFVTLDETPHVLFAGNQPSYRTTVAEGASGQKTRLVCVPTFSTTKTIVMLNVRTQECYPVEFAGLD